MKNLIEELQKINKELAACEEVLNDGIDYGIVFYKEVHAEIKSLIKKSVEIKGRLTKEFGVIAI